MEIADALVVTADDFAAVATLRKGVFLIIGPRRMREDVDDGRSVIPGSGQSGDGGGSSEESGERDAEELHDERRSSFWFLELAVWEVSNVVRLRASDCGFADWLWLVA